MGVEECRTASSLPSRACKNESVVGDETGNIN